MSRFVLSSDELNQLHGAGPVAFVVYVWLRSWMDFATGVVGASHTISIRMLEECCERHITRGAGVQVERPSRKEVRVALDELLRRGLLQRRGNGDLLVFFMPCAAKGELRPNQTGPSAGRVRAGNGDFCKPAQVDDVYGDSGRLSTEPGRGAEGNDPSNRAYIWESGNLVLEVLSSSSSKISREVAVDKSLLLPGGKPVSRPVQIAVLVRKWEAEHSRIAALTGSHPKVLAWAEAGLTDDQLADAYSAAVADRDAKKDKRAISAGFLDVFVSKVLNPPVVVQGVGSGSAGGRQGPWHQSWQGICAKAAELGLRQGKDELAPHFKLRVYRAAGVTEQELRCATVDAGRR